MQALLSKDALLIENCLEDMLEDSISISINDLTDTKKYFVHSLLDEILIATPRDLGWKLSSNKESGIGFPDIIFKNRTLG